MTQPAAMIGLNHDFIAGARLIIYCPATQAYTA